MFRNSGFRIATVAGIPISVDVSFFISFILITGLFGLSILPDAVDPDPSTLTTVVLSVLAGLIFFVSLLLHELAHSIVGHLVRLVLQAVQLHCVRQDLTEARPPGMQFLARLLEHPTRPPARAPHPLAR